MYEIKKIISSFRSAAVLGDGFSQKIKIFLIAFYFPVQRVLGVQHKKVFIVRIKAFGKIIPMHLTDGSDIGVLNEVFIQEQYKVNLEAEPELIVDLGSNVGFSVLYFAVKYPNAIVHAVEPDPVTYLKLLKNVAPYKNIQTHNLAIADTDGNISFFAHPASSMSSSLIRRSSDSVAVNVICRKLDTFCTEEKLASIDLVKFDVEGSEYKIFSAFARIESVKTYIGEIHLDLMEETEAEFRDLFRGFSFKRNATGPKRFLLEISKN